MSRYRLIPYAFYFVLWWDAALAIGIAPNRIPRLDDQMTMFEYESEGEALWFREALYVEQNRESDITPATLFEEGKAVELPLDQPCMQFDIQPDPAKLQQNMMKGPVVSTGSSAAMDAGPLHLFISGPAYGGTTALYSLVSTSPETSNLCRAKTLNCEGSWLLMRDGLMSYENRHDAAYPDDWSVALKTFQRYWNMSKRVVVEKSPNNLQKFTHIHRDLHTAGKNAAFLYVVRSPCYPPRQKRWDSHMDMVVSQVRELQSAGARVHVVRLEDMLGDPYRASAEILQFLPELGSLNPMLAGLSDAPYVEEGDERSTPLAAFVKMASPFHYGMRFNQSISITSDDSHFMRELGYDRSYWDSRRLATPA